MKRKADSTLEQEKKKKIKRTLTQLEIEGDGLTRTNSQQFDDAGVGKKITYSTRNYVGGHDFSDFQGKEKDVLKVAVFSREASRNFATRYHRLRNTDSDFFWLNKGKEDETNNLSSIKTNLLKNVKSSSVNNYNAGLTDLFENKEKPHVISVLEGPKDVPPTFTLEEGDRSYNYTLQDFSIEDSSNATQHMHFYVREDMQEAIKIGQQEIIAQKKYQSKTGFKSVTKTKKDTFSVGEIQFESESESEEGKKKYSMLVGHIPNDFTGTAAGKNLDKMTHNALQQHKIEGRTVVGYIGDTNYKDTSILPANSIPSVGGNIEGGNFVVGTSSTQIGSNFMLAVSNGKDPKADSFIMTQPSTLNDVDLAFGVQKPATDHPSIQTTIVLDSKILGRDYDYIKQKDQDSIEEESLSEKIEEIIEEDSFSEKTQESSEEDSPQEKMETSEEKVDSTALEKGRAIINRFKEEVTQKTDSPSDSPSMNNSK